MEQNELDLVANETENSDEIDTVSGDLLFSTKRRLTLRAKFVIL